MIRIENLKKSYSGTTILENVSLQVDKQDTVVIIGGSGCGKSTLLRCINRLEIPDSGRILIDGQDILAPGAPVEQLRRKLGMVYQSFNLFSHLNVMENMILAPMRVLGLTQRQAMDQAEELLETVGMQHHRYSMPQTLSGGQKQRVAIARAMAMHPEVLLFDEPTSALDPTMVDEVEAVIRRLTRSGMTCVIVTHEMRFAHNVATKVVFLAERGVYEQGTPEQIFEHPSRELTRQFLYRSRLLEQTLRRDSADIYAMSSAIRAFAAPYGFDSRRSRGLDYLGDELILPILRACDDPGRTVEVRFVADDGHGSHQMLIGFPGLEADPLTHPALDELNLMLLRSFTRQLDSRKNGHGHWEVQALL